MFLVLSTFIIYRQLRYLSFLWLFQCGWDPDLRNETTSPTPNRTTHRKWLHGIGLKWLHGTLFPRPLRLSLITPFGWCPSKVRSLERDFGYLPRPLNRCLSTIEIDHRWTTSFVFVGSCSFFRERRRTHESGWWSCEMTVKRGRTVDRFLFKRSYYVSLLPT